MALPNPNFQIDVSKEFLQLTQELGELEKMRDLETVIFDDESQAYQFAPPTPYAPLTQEQYDDLMEARALRYTVTAIADKQQAIVHVQQPAGQQYADLKQALQQELLTTGHNGPAILDFDDVSMTIEIGCGFKEFIDRFTAIMPQVRTVIAPDQADVRPFQDIFRTELAKPSVKQSYEDTFRNALSDCRGQGDQAYNDPANPVDLDGTASGDEAIGAVFYGDTGQPGIPIVPISCRTT